MEIKRHWLGQKWYLPGAAGNNINQTNVPNLRLAYRHQTLLEELAMLRTKEKSPATGTAQVGETADMIGARAMAVK